MVTENQFTFYAQAPTVTLGRNAVRSLLGIPRGSDAEKQVLSALEKAAQS